MWKGRLGPQFESLGGGEGYFKDVEDNNEVKETEKVDSQDKMEGGGTGKYWEEITKSQHQQDITPH